MEKYSFLYFVFQILSVMAGFVIGSFLWGLVSKKKPTQVVYQLDMSLMNESESLDQFIMRAFNEGLGSYRIV
jgi:hypothetical protein